MCAPPELQRPSLLQRLQPRVLCRVSHNRHRTSEPLAAQRIASASSAQSAKRENERHPEARSRVQRLQSEARHRSGRDSEAEVRAQRSARRPEQSRRRVRGSALPRSRENESRREEHSRETSCGHLGREPRGQSSEGDRPRAEQNARRSRAHRSRGASVRSRRALPDREKQGAREVRERSVRTAAEDVPCARQSMRSPHCAATRALRPNDPTPGRVESLEKLVPEGSTAAAAVPTSGPVESRPERSGHFSEREAGATNRSGQVSGD